jgi:prepilin-type N-terminal cleavage/methylation domain-containing protein
MSVYSPIVTARRCAGFTVVELLVVIAIVAVIAVIIGGAVHFARNNALQAGSISNLRQIYLAATTYSDSHDGMHPYFLSNTLGPDSIRLYKQQLKPYVRSEEVYYCPRDPKSRREHMGVFTNHRDSSYELIEFNIFALQFDSVKQSGKQFAAPFRDLPNMEGGLYLNSNIQENAERDGLPRSTMGYSFAWLMLDGSARWVDVRRERQRSGEVVGD